MSVDLDGIYDIAEAAQLLSTKVPALRAWCNRNPHFAPRKFNRSFIFTQKDIDVVRRLMTADGEGVCRWCGAHRDHDPEASTITTGDAEMPAESGE